MDVPKLHFSVSIPIEEGSRKVFNEYVDLCIKYKIQHDSVWSGTGGYYGIQHGETKVDQTAWGKVYTLAQFKDALKRGLILTDRIGVKAPFDDVPAGLMVVRTKNMNPSGSNLAKEQLAGAIIKTTKSSVKGDAHYKGGGSASIYENEWRLATVPEITAYNTGIYNIMDMIDAHPFEGGDYLEPVVT